jgi:hypothetical protein
MAVAPERPQAAQAVVVRRWKQKRRANRISVPGRAECDAHNPQGKLLHRRMRRREFLSPSHLAEQFEIGRSVIWRLDMNTNAVLFRRQVQRTAIPIQHPPGADPASTSFLISRPWPRQRISTLVASLTSWEPDGAAIPWVLSRPLGVWSPLRHRLLLQSMPGARHPVRIARTTLRTR